MEMVLILHYKASYMYMYMHIVHVAVSYNLHVYKLDVSDIWSTCTGINNKIYIKKWIL